LAVVDHIWFWGWAALPGFLLVVLPLTAFLMALVFLFLRQVNARRQTQRLLGELEMAHQQLAAYAEEVETLTLATERQRMARELHDTLAQGLAGLILQLEAVESYLERSNTERAQAIVGQAMGRARSTLTAARRAIDDLRNEEEPLDLNQAVREEIRRFSESSGLPCIATLRAPARLPTPLAEAALRTVGEGLTNVVRHARAQQTWVSLLVDGQALVVTVRDDGIGLTEPKHAQNGHYGLLGLRERARLVGGCLEVTHLPNGGTSLTLRLPLPTAEPGEEGALL
jgi:NarL family two-component system sensor histidine kinase YdfH